MDTIKIKIGSYEYRALSLYSYESRLKSFIPKWAGMKDQVKIIGYIHVADKEIARLQSESITEDSQCAFRALKDSVKRESIVSSRYWLDKIKTERKVLVLKERLGIRIKAVFDGEKWKVIKDYKLSLIEASLTHSEYREKLKNVLIIEDKQGEQRLWTT